MGIPSGASSNRDPILLSRISSTLHEHRIEHRCQRDPISASFGGRAPPFYDLPDDITNLDDVPAAAAIDAPERLAETRLVALRI